MDVYDDNYPTCAETFATLRIFSALVSAAEISQRIGVEASRTHTLGDPVSPTTNAQRKDHAWFLSSKGHVVSRDTRRHLDWLLDQIEPSLDELRRLRTEGAHMDIMSYWVSASGEGGPAISSRQMERLAPFGIDCWWDVYFDQDECAG